MLLQCCEEAAFSEDAEIILWHAVGPVEVDQKAVQHNQTLEFHAVVFFVASIYEFLKNTGVTHLADGAINEK